MKDILRQFLSQREKHSIVDTNRLSAAVLVPLTFKNGEYHILFTKRTAMVKYHKGEISFPGGTYEEEDVTLLNTALRESAEEIGVRPEAVDVLGELDDILTITSNFIVTPFVAAILQPRSLKLNPMEIEEILEIPISVLLDKNCLHQATENIDGGDITTYTYSYQGRLIWGATAKILYQFIDIFTRVIGMSRASTSLLDEHQY
ncbi:NUDIX hydrolase [Chloroflexota bacterium]